MRTRGAALAALVALAVLGLVWPRERTHLEENSFGVVPGGHRALVELLERLDVPVSRSYLAPARLDPEAVVWWIQPRQLCGAQADWDARAWIEAGGRALVFLSTRRGDECDELAGFALPPLESDADTAAEAACDADVADDAGPSDDAEPEAPPAAGSVDALLAGDLLPRSRRLDSALRAFAPPEPGTWNVRARLAERPFVLEREIGRGRLVVVADGAFLTNRGLERGDAAPLVLDLVRAFGVPRLDERAHGLRGEERPLPYLASSPAMPVFAALVLLGLLVIWQGTALPRRSVAEFDPGAPTLEAFVESLGVLYARSRDLGPVAERYRELSLARVRRHLDLPPDTPDRVLLERLVREGRVPEPELARLAPGAGAAVASARELRAWTRQLDVLVEEACA